MTLHEEITAELERIREGWCDPEKGIAIAEKVMQEDCKTCVEIGVFAGKSLISAAIGLSKKGDGIIYGVDSWQVSDCLVDVPEADAREWWSHVVNLEGIYNMFIGNIHASGMAKHIRVLRMTSLDASKVIPSPIDFLHIDGTHSEWSSTSDVCLWLPKIRSGGIVLLDDSNWNSTQTAVRFTEKWCDRLETITGKESTSTFFRKR